jgi:hypothetical protein
MHLDHAASGMLQMADLPRACQGAAGIFVALT